MLEQFFKMRIIFENGLKAGKAFCICIKGAKKSFDFLCMLFDSALCKGKALTTVETARRKNL